MALADILTEVNALLTGVTSKIGSEFVHEHNAPPWIVWEPAQDEFELGAMGGNHRGKYPASIGTRIAGVNLHIWAKGGTTDSAAELGALEALINRVLWAIRRVVTDSNLVIRGGEWEGGDGETIAQYGRGYLLRLGFRLPIADAAADAPETTKVIGNVDDIGATMDFPNSDVTGAPAP